MDRWRDSFRWVQHYTPKFEQRWKRFARSAGGSWRMDETYIKVRGAWVYLYWAVDKQGLTFMVERGHNDGVAPDEWVAYEYSKVRRFYDTKMNLPEATTIEFFTGPHTIHGEGTFEFLRNHLHWPPAGQ